MPDRWIIRVAGKEYGPVDFEVLKEWNREGRLLPTNEARRERESHWSSAGAIPGLFQIEASPTPTDAIGRPSSVTAPESIISDQKLSAKPPTRNIFTETFRIYFSGFMQFFGLTLLAIVPSLCSQFMAAMTQSAPNENFDVRTLVTAAFSVSMFVLTLVLWPVYVAAIQILSAELIARRRIGFLSTLNQAVKYWPRVAGLCIFVYAIFGLLTGFGIAVVFMLLAATVSGSLFAILFALGLSVLQIWLFARFFVNVLFWQQFAVLENATAIGALRASRNLARSNREFPWYQRPLWRAAMIVSLCYAVIIAIEVVAYWPKLVAAWPLAQSSYDQLMSGQDSQAMLQKLLAEIPHNQTLNLREIGCSILVRIVELLVGIAFVVLYLDSKGDDPSEEPRRFNSG